MAALVVLLALTKIVANAAGGEETWHASPQDETVTASGDEWQDGGAMSEGADGAEGASTLARMIAVANDSAIRGANGATQSTTTHNRGAVANNALHKFIVHGSARGRHALRLHPAHAARLWRDVVNVGIIGLGLGIMFILVSGFHGTVKKLA